MAACVLSAETVSVKRFLPAAKHCGRLEAKYERRLKAAKSKAKRRKYQSKIYRYRRRSRAITDEWNETVFRNRVLCGLASDKERKHRNRNRPSWRQ